jgi:ubiquinone/menaquinone biosynthesis C-methylase UbiE
MRLLILFCGAVLAMAAQHKHQPGHQHHHGPRSTEEWIKILENPERDGWQKPDEVVAAMALQPGQSVADIGAGTGYFSVRFAQAVGPEGKVFAVDIDEGLVKHLGERARESHLANLEPVLATPSDPNLPARSVDSIFICDVLHHIGDRADYYPKLAAALKAGGRLVIVDFHKRELPVGPGPEMKLDKDLVIGEISQAGFRLTREFDFLPYQYFLVFESPSGE